MAGVDPYKLLVAVAYDFICYMCVTGIINQIYSDGRIICQLLQYNINACKQQDRLIILSFVVFYTLQYSSQRSWLENAHPPKANIVSI